MDEKSSSAEVKEIDRPDDKLEDEDPDVTDESLDDENPDETDDELDDDDDSEKDTIETVRAEGAVKTVTAAGAISSSESRPSPVIAFVGGKYIKFAQLGHVPAGSRVYQSKEEIRKESKKKLEAIFASVRGHASHFKNQSQGAEAVWTALMSLPLFDPKGNSLLPGDVDRDSGDRKYSRKRDPDMYHIKPETEKSRKAVAELAPQARDCAAIIRADGRTRISETEMKKLMEDNKDKLHTRQVAWRIFQYYRSKLMRAEVLSVPIDARKK